MIPLAALLPVVRYCERGTSPDLWAEPVNALTNAGYLVAAASAYAVIRATALSSDDRAWLNALCIIAASVGIGSALLHTAPSSITKTADVVPIAVFVALALYVALRRVLGLTAGTTLAWLVALGCAAAAIAASAARFGCGNGSCLNGAPAYLPVLVALVATARATQRLRSPAARPLLFASAVFAFALTARTIDVAVCPLFSLGPLAITAHALWHLGTALAAYLVLRGLAHGLAIPPTS